MVSEYEIKEQICEIGKRMYGRNMVAANDGNISVRISDHEILCTPTGVSKGFMTPEDICKIDMDGSLIQANPGRRPSSEMKMHLRVYKERADVRAVVHAHPVLATTFAVANIPLSSPIMPETIINFGCVPVAKYGRPSTAEIPDAISEFLPYFDAQLLEKHGALTYSDSLEAAYLKMESVEFYAQLLYQSKLLGVPRELSMQQVEELYELRRRQEVGGRHPANLGERADACRFHCTNCGRNIGNCETDS